MRCPGFGVEYQTNTGEIRKSCDTYYAVDPSFKNTWEKLSAENIIERISKLIPNYKIDIVITGGEPLLNWNNEEFQNLLKYYINNGHKVTIETNASLDIEFTNKYQKEIIFSMSVKLSNSLEKLKKRFNKETLTKVLNNTKNSYLKFVVNKEFEKKANEEIKEILSLIPKAEVYLMPMGNTAKEININSEAIINMAINNDYKYSDRLHIRVWDDKRGV